MVAWQVSSQEDGAEIAKPEQTTRARGAQSLVSTTYPMCLAILVVGLVFFELLRLKKVLHGTEHQLQRGFWIRCSQDASPRHLSTALQSGRQRPQLVGTGCGQDPVSGRNRTEQDANFHGLVRDTKQSIGRDRTKGWGHAQPFEDGLLFPQEDAVGQLENTLMDEPLLQMCGELSPQGPVRGR